jgi:hypothetical protein
MCYAAWLKLTYLVTQQDLDWIQNFPIPNTEPYECKLFIFSATVLDFGPLRQASIPPVISALSSFPDPVHGIRLNFPDTLLFERIRILLTRKK